MTYIPLGYTAPPEALVGNAEARTKCDLSIPNRNAGERLAMVLGTLPEIPAGTQAEIKRILEDIDANFTAIEQWAGYFFRNCICHCEEDDQQQ